MKCVRCGFEVEQSMPVCPYCGMGLKVDMAAQSRFSGPYSGQAGSVDQAGVPSQMGSQLNVPPQREPQFNVPPQRPQPQMNVPPMYGNMPAGQTLSQGGYNGQAANMADIKKDKYMPNIINIIAMLLAVVVAFLPYGFIAGRVNTIYTVFGIGSALFIMGILVAVTDIACAFVGKLVTDIVCLIESLFIGGLYIAEFILAVRDLKIMGGSIIDGAYARLLWGSWASLVVAVLLILSVPLWLVIKKKKNNSR